MATNTTTKSPNVATQLVSMAQTNAIYFHSPDGRELTRISENGVNRIEKLRSRSFRSWISKLYYTRKGTGPGSRAVEDALNTLCGIALYDGHERPVSLRVAENNNSLYVDLGDPDWTAVEITPQGWRLTKDPPVLFYRPHGMAALPSPETGGNWDDLFSLLNIDRMIDTRMLIISWILGAYQPSGPYPLLALYGEQGSAKSFTTRVLRSLIDPNVSMLRSVPKDLHDLAISVFNSHVVAFDNISNIPDWMSDALCRTATGGGYGTRQLWTDDEEIVLEAIRPVILNGISEIIRQPDLLERTILLELPSVSDDERRSERELWGEFQENAPRIMGCIFDALSCVLANLSKVKLGKLPRMADFAIWIAAAAPALGVPSSAPVDAFKKNQKNAERNMLDNDPLAVAIDKLMLIHMRNPWSGTATELLNALKTCDYLDAPNAYSLSVRLRKLIPPLRKAGIVVRIPNNPPRKISITIP